MANLVGWQDSADATILLCGQLPPFAELPTCRITNFKQSPNNDPRPNQIATPTLAFKKGGYIFAG